MKRLILSVTVMAVVLAAAFAFLIPAVPTAKAQGSADGGVTYKVDPAHASICFESTHMGATHIFGLFTDTQGTFTLNKDDAAGSSFSFSTRTSSVNTGVAQRDTHLKSPDFFNAKEFPNITFKSTKVAAGSAAGTYDVTGDLTLHGVTKSVTVSLQVLGDYKDQKGGQHAGLVTEFSLNRSDYGMKTMLSAPGKPGVGDEIKLRVGIEGGHWSADAPHAGVAHD